VLNPTLGKKYFKKYKKPNAAHPRLAPSPSPLGRHHHATTPAATTTTPRLAMDGLTLKAATAIDNLTLKSYSDRLLQTL